MNISLRNSYFIVNILTVWTIWKVNMPIELTIKNT